MLIDFHLHSTYSDGALTPEEIIDETYRLLKEIHSNASKKNKKKHKVAIISITDHDTTKHINPALDYAYKRILEENEMDSGFKVYVVPGVEISTTRDHILTYFNPYDAKWEDEEYQKMLGEINDFREEKFDDNCDILNSKYSFLELDSLKIKKEWFGTLGKPTLADEIQKRLKQLNLVLDSENKIKCDLTTIYRKCLNKLPKKDYPIQSADLIRLVHKLDGFSVIAHPKLYDGVICHFIGECIDGFEIPKKKGKRQKYIDIVSKNELISTRGSDCHFQEYNWNNKTGKYKFGFKTYETLETYTGGAFAYLKDFETKYVPTCNFSKN